MSALRSVAATLTEWAGRAYVAGPALDDALGVCDALSARGIASSLGLRNRRGEAPAQIAQSQVAAIEAAANRRDCTVSIKLPPLAFDSAIASRIARAGESKHVRVHIDAMGHEAADRTLALASRWIYEGMTAGITLPGRWRRSRRDAQAAIRLGARVRVVKGEWGDPTAPDFDPQLGFLAVIDALAGSARHVAVATHDLPLAAEALSRLRTRGTPCELELLYGLPMRRSLDLARHAGVPVRVYIPYGVASLPYELSRRSDPMLLARGLRDAVFGRAFRLGL